MSEGLVPLATQFQHQSPYVFTDNNPIKLWDPDGCATMGGGIVFCGGFRKGIGSNGRLSGYLNMSLGYHRRTENFSGLAYASMSVYGGTNGGNNLGGSSRMPFNADISAGLFGALGGGSGGAHLI